MPVVNTNFVQTMRTHYCDTLATAHDYITVCEQAVTSPQYMYVCLLVGPATGSM